VDHTIRRMFKLIGSILVDQAYPARILCYFKAPWLLWTIKVSYNKSKARLSATNSPETFATSNARLTGYGLGQDSGRRTGNPSIGNGYPTGI